MKKVYLIIYGGDTINGLVAADTDTKERCDYAIQWMQQHKRADTRFIIILAAGKRPKKNYPPLKEAMRAYIEKQLSVLHGMLEIDHTIVLAKTDVWTTFFETIAAMQMIPDPVENEVVVCSSKCHLPRIRLAWDLLSIINVQFIGPHSLRPLHYVLLYESLAILKLIKTYMAFCINPEQSGFFCTIVSLC